MRYWIYVSDHCKAVEVVLKKGKPGEVYNISAGEEKTNLEVAGEILRVMGMGKDDGYLERVEDGPGHDLRYSLDLSKTRALGWKPEQSFREGLEDTVGWYYLKNEVWWRPLVDERTLHSAPWKLAWGSEKI